MDLSTALQGLEVNLIRGSIREMRPLLQARGGWSRLALEGLRIEAGNVPFVVHSIETVVLSAVEVLLHVRLSLHHILLAVTEELRLSSAVREIVLDAVLVEVLELLHLDLRHIHLGALTIRGEARA